MTNKQSVDRHNIRQDIVYKTLKSVLLETELLINLGPKLNKKKLLKYRSNFVQIVKAKSD